MNSEGIRKIEVEIEEWMEFRDNLGRRECANINNRMLIDDLNDNIIDCQQEYKRLTGEYYERS